MCRSELFAAFANKQADRAIRCLRVFCTNKEKGCQWQGEVNGIIKHLRNGCKFKKVACPNDCGVALQRQHITTHLSTCPYRKTECQFCHTIGTYLLIEGVHKEQCPKFPIGCPNKCEVGNIPRDDVEEHMKICPLGLIQCEYHVMGCTEKINRKDQKKHNKFKIEQHLSLTMHLLNDITNTRQQQTTDHSQTLFYLCFTSAFVVLVAWLSCINTINIITEELDNVKQALAVCNNQSRNQKIDEYSSKATQNPGKGDTTLVAKGASQTVVHKEALKKEDTFLNWLFGYSDDETQVQIPTWPAKLYSESAKSSHGDQRVPVIVKMSEYSKKYKNDIDWFSEPFYTYGRRYKNVRAAGDVTYYLTHLSVRVISMSGSRHNVNYCNVQLLNQISNSKHYSVSGKQYRDYVWQRSDFVTTEYLNTATSSCQYLKNDEMFFEIDCDAYDD